MGRPASLDVTVLSGSCAVDEGVLANDGRLVLRAGVCAGVERVSVDDCLSVLFETNDNICVISLVRLMAAPFSLPDAVLPEGERLTLVLFISGLDSGSTEAASVDDSPCVVAGSDGLVEDSVTLLAGDVLTLLCPALAKEESMLVISCSPVLLPCEPVTGGVEATIDDNG